MGYTTNFNGSFNITPALSPDDHSFLTKFSETRRMARNVGTEYGVQGEFYVGAEGIYGQDDDATVIDYNRPPSTQPGLWCQWIPNEDGTILEWDGGEKFYSYVEWLEYLINSILAPRGYTLNGQCEWQGEESDDFGKIVVVNNVVTAEWVCRVYD